jgi:TolA-binding protein
MPGEKITNDMLARGLAVILTAMSMVYASAVSTDRFTGAQGAVHAEKIRQLEEKVENMPPQWLKRDLEKIDSRLERIEVRLETIEHGD